MEILSSFAVGIPNDQTWSQAYAINQGDNFFGVIVSIQSPDPDAAQTGKAIVDRCLEFAKETWGTEQYLALFKEFQGEGISIAGLYISQAVSMLYTQGEVGIQLTRDRKSQILARGGAEGAFVKGPTVVGDYFALTTNAFQTHFGTQDFTKHPRQICDEVAVSIHEAPDSARLCGLYVELATKDIKPDLVPIKSKIPAITLKLPKLPQIQITRLMPRSVKGKKTLRLVIALVLVLLLLIGFSSYLSVRRTAKINASLAPYSTRLTTLAAFTPDQRLAEMQGLRELARDLAAVQKSSKDHSLTPGYTQLLTKVNQQFANISGEKQQDKLHIFYDFRLIAADFVANSEAYDIPGKLAVFLDNAHQRILSLSLEQKEALTLSVTDKLKTPIALGVSDRQAYVLGDDGVMQLSLPLDVMGSVVVNRDATWVTPKFVDTFGTNTYVLDSGARNILKYDLQNPQASPTGWLKNKAGLDFETITSLKIDGTVWLGTMTGKILHFTQGAPTSFTYQGVLDLPSSPVYLYTSQASTKLYVLEPHANRLLVLGKDGTYQEAIISPDLSTATGVVVDETTNKAYVLSGSLVYEVAL